MKPSNPTDLVPLTDDEKDFLLFIFKKRRRLLIMVYSIFIAAVIFICLFSFGMDTIRNLLVPKDDIKYDSTWAKWLFTLVFISSALLITGTYIYVKRVLPFREDAESGVKERLAYIITRKEYFSLTNQYYVMFDDPLYMHHETDQETWYNCYEGGYFFIYRAKKSKFVFEENGRFSMM